MVKYIGYRIIDFLLNNRHIPNPRWRERMKGFCAAAREKVEAAEGKVQ